jgi:hypothetical protein
VKIFLDSSVLLAAAGSALGASRGLFDIQQSGGWRNVIQPMNPKLIKSRGNR